MALEFEVWRDLASAYVACVAEGFGWCVVRRRRSRSTRSVYIDLAKGAASACVRLSDHRPSRRDQLRASMFSVRQAATLRLEVLPDFLASRVAQLRA